MRRGLSVIFAFVLLAMSAGTVLGHHTDSISAEADCSGETRITVVGQVFNGVKLIVSVDGSVIYSEPQYGSSQTRTFVIYTTTDPGEHTARAWTSDNNSKVKTTFVTPGACETATPTPTPSPTPTPEVTPSPTPEASETPSMTSTPAPSQSPSLPDTATMDMGEASKTIIAMALAVVGIGLLLAVGVALISTGTRRR